MIDGAEETLRLVERDGALAAEIGLQIGHEKSGGDAFAGNVTDDQAETVRAEVEEVVIVASHGTCREAVTRVVSLSIDGRICGKSGTDFRWRFQVPARRGVRVRVWRRLRGAGLRERG